MRRGDGAGISVLLAECRDIRVVGAVGDGHAAVREAARLAPRVALMDISMPGLNGIEATRAIVRKSPQIGVLNTPSAKASPGSTELSEFVSLLQASVGGRAKRTVDNSDQGSVEAK
ncbi:MAG: response regulator transcription factor [Pseudomonadota bacterium]